MYNFLSKDEKQGEISTYFCLKHRCEKKSDIFHTVYPNKNHVITHPVNVSPSKLLDVATLNVAGV